MSDFQRSPAEQRHHSNELLTLVAQRKGEYTYGADGAVNAVRAAGREDIVEQVLGELYSPAPEARSLQPAASAVLGATVETAPAMPEKTILDDERQPDIVEQEGYMTAMEQMGTKVDAAYGEIIPTLEDEARARLDAVFGDRESAPTNPE